MHSASASAAKIKPQGHNSVLGIPLNRDEPEVPGKTRDSQAGRATTSLINSAGCCLSGNNNGQYGAEHHWDTTKVLAALVAWACLKRQGIRNGGGHHQLISPLQSHVKASTASEPGFQYHDAPDINGCAYQRTYQWSAAPISCPTL